MYDRVDKNRHCLVPLSCTCIEGQHLMNLPTDRNQDNHYLNQDRYQNYERRKRFQCSDAHWYFFSLFFLLRLISQRIDINFHPFIINSHISWVISTRDLDKCLVLVFINTMNKQISLTIFDALTIASNRSGDVATRIVWFPTNIGAIRDSFTKLFETYLVQQYQHSNKKQSVHPILSHIPKQNHRVLPWSFKWFSQSYLNIFKRSHQSVLFSSPWTKHQTSSRSKTWSIHFTKSTSHFKQSGCATCGIHGTQTPSISIDDKNRIQTNKYLCSSIYRWLPNTT